MVDAKSFRVKIIDRLRSAIDWIKGRLESNPSRTLPYRIGLVSAALLGFGVVALLVWTHLRPVLWLDDIPITSVADAAITQTLTEFWQRLRNRPLTVLIAGRTTQSTAADLGCVMDAPRTQQRLVHIKKAPPGKPVSRAAPVKSTSLLHAMKPS